MERRRMLQAGAWVWALVGAGVAFRQLGSVNADARLVIGVVSVVGPVAAVTASRLLARGADRRAGAFLLVSVLTPTYFAYVLNMPALVFGTLLLTAPRFVLRRESGAPASRQPA